MKIIICDDSALIRKQLKDLLISNGYLDVTEAVNGFDCSEKFKEVSADLIFMDIVMPIMTGVEALGKIMSPESSVKVVMLTSSGTKNNLREALELGAYDFIQKPLDKKQILDIIGKIERGL